jgi:hypothetical protein
MHRLSPLRHFICFYVVDSDVIVSTFLSNTLLDSEISQEPYDQHIAVAYAASSFLLSCSLMESQVSLRYS